MTNILLSSTLSLLMLSLLILINKKMSLGHRVFISFLFGISNGLALSLATHNKLFEILHATLFILGQGYLAFLKMLVIPLILSSIIYSILNLGTHASIKKISLYTCGLLLGMTSLASLIGILIAKLFALGDGFTLPVTSIAPKQVYTGFIETLLGMIPSNPIAAMVNENSIAIVLLAVLIGIAAHKLEQTDNEKREIFKKATAVFFAIVKKLTSLILSLTPYGTFALMSLLVVDQGTHVLLGMIKFIVAMYVAMFLVVLMHSILLFLSGRNPYDYLKKASVPLFVAFTTRSSFATLPITEETLREKFKTHQTIASFVPSIGATIGMNACAGIFPAMLVVMTLSILHLPLTPIMILMIMFINAIASLGISGIPGTAYIAATVTLTSLHLPFAIVGLVQGIDPIIDMGRTATNINGVMTTALLVDNFNK